MGQIRAFWVLFGLRLHNVETNEGRLRFCSENLKRKKLAVLPWWRVVLNLPFFYHSHPLFQKNQGTALKKVTERLLGFFEEVKEK